MKISRLVSIIMILLEKERVSAQELAAMFEVSKRTIYRDIDAINLAGIPVVSTPGVNGGIEIMKNYKLDKHVFSSNEITTILTGLSSLTTLVENEELVNAVIKMRSLIPNDKVQEIEFKADQIRIDLSQWIGYRNLQPYLESLKLAILERKQLSFDYTNRNGTVTERHVEPYQILLKGTHWYFHGYCCVREDFRLFKLSRMSNLKLKESTFQPREHQPAVLDFSDHLKEIQTTITLRVHQSLMERILDFCEYDDCSSDGEEHFIVQFPFIENDYYYTMLLSFGETCECLEPPHVRQELKQKIARVAKLYEG